MKTKILLAGFVTVMTLSIAYGQSIPLGGRRGTPYAGAKTNYDAIDRAATPGNTTINKPKGRVAVAAAGTAVVVSNNLVSNASVVLAEVQTIDATCTDIKAIVPGNNTFTITMNAACTGITRVGFVVF